MTSVLDKVGGLGVRLPAQQLSRYPMLLADDRAIGAINPVSNWGVRGGPGPIASSAWPQANAAMYMPFRVPVPVTVDRLAVGCGTSTGGNFDVGIYNEAGTRIVSTGSTAKPGASQESIVDITDTLLRPGLYYFGMATDGVTGYISGNFSGTFPTILKAMGIRQQTSAFPLPATATFATQTFAYYPMMTAYLKRETLKPWNGPVRWPPLNVINPLSAESLGGLVGDTLPFSLSSFASGVPGQNVITYTPFVIVEHATVVKLSLLTGGTQNGNVDVGIFDAAGNKLVSSGSTAQGAANTAQEFDVTDTRLGPGLYYVGSVSNSATGTLVRTAPTDEFMQGLIPILTESGFPLPASMTPTNSTSATPFVNWFGVHFNTLF